jgi:hypothetical protein
VLDGEAGVPSQRAATGGPAAALAGSSVAKAIDSGCTPAVYAGSPGLAVRGFAFEGIGDYGALFGETRLPGGVPDGT